MTHLLIPIEVIKEKIQRLETGLKNYKDFWSPMTSDWEKSQEYQQGFAKLDLYKNMLGGFKKIALDEVSIEEAASKHSVGDNVWSKESYKQALNDLL